MPAVLALLLRLLHHPAERFIDLQMRALRVLDPDEIRNTVDCRFQYIAVYPVLLALLDAPEQRPEIKLQALFRSRQRPNRVQLLQQLRMIQGLTLDPAAVTVYDTRVHRRAAHADIRGDISQRHIQDQDTRI